MFIFIIFGGLKNMTEDYTLTYEDGSKEIIKVNGYRAMDHKLVLIIQSYTTELPKLVKKFGILKGVMKEVLENVDKENVNPEDLKSVGAFLSRLDSDDYSDEEIGELMELVSDIQNMQDEVNYLGTTLGQRGIKRYKYDDDLTKLYVMRAILTQKKNTREEFIFLLELDQQSSVDDIIRAIINDGREKELLTKEELIDCLPDENVDIGQLSDIGNIMIKLGMPNRQLPGSGKGKRKKL
jgi:hypothetical protein